MPVKDPNCYEAIDDLDGMPEDEEEEERRVKGFDGLPLEVQRCIFEYLGAHDLWSCLYVSRRWRTIANDNLLWTPHCLDEGLLPEQQDRNLAKTTSKQIMEPLCSSAVMWISWINGPVTKWKLKKPKSVARERFSLYACCASYRHTLAVYKSEKSLIMLYIKKHTKIIPIPEGFCKVGTIFMNDKYVIGSCREGFLVYLIQPDGSYKLHLIFGIFDCELTKFNSMEDWVGEYFWSLELVGIYQQDILIVTALGARFFYIVDLRNGSWIKVHILINVEESISCDKYFVLRGGTCASVFAPQGDHIVTSDHTDQTDNIEVCINNTTCAVFWTHGWEIFDLPSGERIRTSEASIVPYHCLLSDEGDLMFIILHEENFCERIAAISLMTGNTVWSKPIKNALNMKILCKRYIHVSTSGMHWYLLDTYSGMRIYTGIGVVEYISDYFSVISDTGDITSISYYGKLHDLYHKREVIPSRCFLS